MVEPLAATVMILVCAVVWGGFLACLLRALSKENERVGE
jgi:hypothetical protein